MTVTAFRKQLQTRLLSYGGFSYGANLSFILSVAMVAVQGLQEVMSHITMVFNNGDALMNSAGLPVQTSFSSTHLAVF